MQHVVIVGGGFGGLEAAKRLGRLPVRVTLIDRRNHHLFQPLLYQVATAGLSPADIAYPIRSVLRKNPNVTVLLGEVVDVDAERRVVRLAEGDEVDYDALVLAAGATHSYFGNQAWERHAPGLKTIEDAIEIRRRVLHAFERAERTDDGEQRRALLTFAVIGAGPTGVEMAGAISEIALRTLSRDFRRIDPTTARVVLVEAADRVLPVYPESLSAKALRQLRALGVEVQTSTRVVCIDDTGLDTDGGRIEARTVVWGAGVQASPLGAALGCELDRAGRVVVDEHLNVPGRPDVFVIGDQASIADGDRVVPGVAPAANQAGRHVAEVIAADLAGQARPRFRYRSKGSLATIGRSSAVANFGRLRFSGVVAWVLWWAVHIAFLVGFRSRAVVMFGWGWSYLTFQRGARLITGRWRSSADTDTEAATSSARS